MENMLIDETDPAIEGICGFDLMIQTKKVFIVSKINEKNYFLRRMIGQS